MVKVIVPRINRVEVVGRLVDDAQKRGENFLVFRIAVPNRYRDKEGNWKDDTTFLDVRYNQTGILDGLKKGMAVYVIGSIRQDQWTDKNGNKRTSYYIRAERIQILTREEEVEVANGESEG